MAVEKSEIWRGKASISQLTHSFEHHLNTFTGGPGPETARVPNVPKPLTIVGGFSSLFLFASPYTPGKSVPVTLTSDNFHINNKEKIVISQL